MKKLILSAAVAAAAVFGAYTANQTKKVVAFDLMNAADIEAAAIDPPDGASATNTKNYLTGPREREEVEVTVSLYSDGSTAKSVNNKSRGGSISAGNGNVGGSYAGGSGSSQYQSSGAILVKTETKKTFGCFCACTNDNYCTDYIP